jgi:predicted small secreted protein
MTAEKEIVMKMSRIALLTLALTLSACNSMPGKQADIDAVMTASGLDAQIALLNKPLSTEKMDGPLAMIPDEWINMVNNSIAQSVKPEEIRKQLRGELQKNLSGPELNAVQAFYQSETGKRVVALESGKAESGKPDSGNSMKIITNDRSTLEALANATGYGKAVSQLAQHGLNDAVDIAVKNGCFGLDQFPFASMLVGVIKKNQLAALRASVNSMVSQRYAQLSAEEQAEYLTFAQSRSGQKFFNARGAVMQDTAQRAGTALSGQLGEEVKKICTAKS